MPTKFRHSKAFRPISLLLLLAGCAPAPNNKTLGGIPMPSTPAGGGSVVVGATGTAAQGVTSNGGPSPNQPLKASLPPPMVTTPVVSNNGSSVIHGSILVPAAILSNNGGGIVSSNGGNVVSPNGGNIVSPNGGNVVSPNGGGIIAPNGGTIIAPNGGTIVSPNGGNFRLSQVPMRYADVKLTDAAGNAIKDNSGNDLVTKTDENGNYSFPVDVRGRNLLVRALVPGQSGALLGLVSNEGAASATTVDLNSTLSLSYIIQNYVGDDLSRFEQLDRQDLEKAIAQTDKVLAEGQVTLPTDLSTRELSKTVDQIRFRVPSADQIFQDIRRRLVPLGNLNEGDGLKGLDADFSQLSGAALATDGSIYFTSKYHHSLWRLDPGGIVHTIVPQGKWGYPEADTTGTPTKLNGVATQADGSLVMADTLNNRVVRVSTQGEVITLAGTGEPGFSGDDGRALDAKLNGPTGICVMTDGSIVVSDTNNSRIRKIDPNGVIRTIVGDGKTSEDLDGAVPGGLHLSNAQGLAVDPNGTLLIADGGHHRIVEVPASNHVARVFNDPASLKNPVNVAISGSDIIVLDDNSPVPHLIGKGLAPSTDWNSSYKAFPGTPFDTGSSVVASILGDRMLFNSGNTLYSGNPTQGFVKVLGVNPQDSDTIIDKGFAVAVSSNGTVYVSDNGANRVFAKAPLGGLHVVAGKADVRFAPPDMKALDFTNPLDAPLPDLGGVAIDPKTDEAVIAVQSGEPSIRRLTKGGSLKVDYKQLKAMVSTSSGEKVEVDVSPRELAFSDSGKLFIAGSSISKTGLGSSVVVGQLHPDGHIDQTIGANTLRACISICVDSRERLYFMDPIVETVYRVDADALVPLWDIDTNFKAEFGNYQPAAVCVGLNGEFYITEGFHVYRFEQSSRKKILIAGSGAPYFSGTSRDERFNIVTRMLMTKSGDLYLLDRDQVKLITASQLSQFN